MTPPPLVLDAPVWATFALANAIIIWICAPRLVRDIRGWIGRR